MAMNTQKILVGGIAAGVVLNVIDFVVHGWLAANRTQVEAEMFKRGLSTTMMSGSAITSYVITDLVVGILLVWTYAAIRPRFGPGARTAGAAAILFWILGSLLTAGYLQIGIMSAGTWVVLALVWLVNLLLAAMVGAKLYTEDSGTAAA